MPDCETERKYLYASITFIAFGRDVRMDEGDVKILSLLESRWATSWDNSKT